MKEGSTDKEGIRKKESTYKSKQTSSPSLHMIRPTILESSSIRPNNIDSLFLEIFRCIRQHLVKGFERVSEYC